MYFCKSMQEQSSISTSGEIADVQVSVSSRFTDFTPLPSNGFNLLFKVKRYGKWQVLKCLKEEHRGNVLYEELLRKEFELGVALEHSCIVRTIGYENVEELGHCIVLEYVDGRSLRDFLQENPSAENRKRVLSHLLDAMDYYHKCQVVHRDLKPSNILVTRNGDNVKVIDFGLADSDAYFILKQPAGTLRYAAPEQKNPQCVVDCRADIYAFGVMLREIFPHRYAFVARKCVQHKAANRYTNAQAVRRAMQKADTLRRFHWLFLMAIGLVIVLFLTFPAKEKTKIELGSATVDEKPMDTVEAVDADTVVVQESVSNQQTEVALKFSDDYQVWLRNTVDGNIAPLEKALRSGRQRYSELEAYDELICDVKTLISVKQYLNRHHISDASERQRYLESAAECLLYALQKLQMLPQYQRLESIYDGIDAGKFTQVQFDSIQKEWNSKDHQLNELSNRFDKM